MTEHTILVAVTVEGTSRQAAEAHLRRGLVDLFVNDPREGASITSWWVAEDDRGDGSDNDSACFVTPGAQSKATALLWTFGLTGRHNLVPRHGPNGFSEPLMDQPVPSRLGDWSREEAPWVVYIERSGPDVAVGPFLTEEEALACMDHGMLVQELCEEDCLDAHVTQPGDWMDPDAMAITQDLDDLEMAMLRKHAADLAEELAALRSRMEES